VILWLGTLGQCLSSADWVTGMHLACSYQCVICFTVCNLNSGLAFISVQLWHLIPHSATCCCHPVFVFGFFFYWPTFT